MTRLRIRAVTLVVAAALAATGGIALAHGEAKKVHGASLELVGQVNNSAPGVTPATSAQFGYVTQLGDRPIANELTFYTDTTTTRVINNGPLRIVSRTGRVTIYRDAAADFADPDSFRDGTPVLSAVLRQQVILNTATGAFTTQNVNTITSRSPFSLGGVRFVVGRPGGVFRTILSGQLASAPPPTAYIAGYTFSSR